MSTPIKDICHWLNNGMIRNTPIRQYEMGFWISDCGDGKSSYEFHSYNQLIKQKHWHDELTMQSFAFSLTIHYRSAHPSFCGNTAKLRQELATAILKGINK